MNAKDVWVIFFKEQQLDKHQLCRKKKSNGEKDCTFNSLLSKMYEPLKPVLRVERVWTV